MKTNSSQSHLSLDVDVGLYIHIPFCLKRCHFCAFYLVVQEERRMQRFLGALESEMAFYGKHLRKAKQWVRTVYLGGGTPTALLPAQLADILGQLGSKFSLTDHCEVTVEATPESLTPEYLDRLLQAGVTRLSIGIQTFDPLERKNLGLSSSHQEAIAGIQCIKQLGFANFNIDLMYGIPGQTVASWGRTLQAACEFEPTHLSCYSLSVEKGTRFDMMIGRGELILPEFDIEQKMMNHAMELLDVEGYEHYEISNWSKPGYSCKHNCGYWQGKDYLGLGPSAQSYMAGCRFGNIPDLHEYCRRLEKSESPVEERAVLSLAQQERERMVFGLRMLQGVPMDWVETNKHDPTWAASLASLVDEEYLVQRNQHLTLTAKGRQFADELGFQLL